MLLLCLLGQWHVSEQARLNCDIDVPGDLLWGTSRDITVLTLLVQGPPAALVALMPVSLLGRRCADMRCLCPLPAFLSPQYGKLQGRCSFIFPPAAPKDTEKPWNEESHIIYVLDFAWKRINPPPFFLSVGFPLFYWAAASCKSPRIVILACNSTIYCHSMYYISNKAWLLRPLGIL